MFSTPDAELSRAKVVVVSDENKKNKALGLFRERKTGRPFMARTVVLGAYRHCQQAGTNRAALANGKPLIVSSDFFMDN